ncbi:NAD-dependent epimerase/dehydratase family protein [Candidatus Pacearchaeota archaeon]|nr:NAD-dependent epimerase/dehydratase family protein [Candidatus Pacearchaeota archaeon]
MKFAIVGGLGYIGQVLQEELIKAGHEFKVIDNDMMDLHGWNDKLNMLDSEDLIKIKEIIGGCDVVVNLAAIVGDQACLEDTRLAMETNCQGVQNIVGICNELNKKIIHTSTCSLYGFNDELLSENSQVFPVDFYGQTKYQQERFILENSRDYCVFRLGTAYGWSPRMRFDLVVNTFLAKVFFKEKLSVFGGNQWRPFVHIRDVSRAIIFAAERELRGIYNLSVENVKISELPQRMPLQDIEVEINEMKEDPRNYKVENSKILNEGFKFEWNLEKGMEEIVEKMVEIKDYQEDKYSNYKMQKVIHKKAEKKNPRILILGAKGMAGHITTEFLKENTNWEILSFDRSNFEVEDSRSWKEKIIQLNSENQIDQIINLIGILKPQAMKDPILAMKINSLFPHELAALCTSLNIKLIHISTDCWEDLDVYGRSKRAGELNYPEHLTIRTSIIGPELKSEGSGLFHWFMGQKEEANGFVNHYWDGVTTLELAKKIKEILESYPELNNTLDLRTKQKVNKFELLNDIKNAFNKDILVNRKETEVIDKTNNNPDMVCEESLREQLIELKEWMVKHQSFYEQYFLNSNYARIN